MISSPLQDQDPRPVLTIDLKKNRLRIYKQTLHMLDDPEYIQFLVSPEKRVLAVRRTADDEKSAIKIYWTTLKDRNQCCEFYSKPFVSRLGRLLNREDDDFCTHRMYGRVDQRRKRVFFDLGSSEIISEEADIFANQMKYTKPLMPYEIFMANIEAGSDKQLIIKELVESSQLEITSSASAGGICAVATLENIYDKYGFDCLDRVLRLCVGTWEGVPQSFSASMLNGVARVLDTYGDRIKDDMFIERVGKVSIKELSRTAKDRRAGSLGYVEAIVIYYNKKNHSALPMTMLYNNNKNKKNGKKDGGSNKRVGGTEGAGVQMVLEPGKVSAV